MSQITWRNVDVPNFSGVTDALRLAASSLQAGLGAGREAIDAFQKDAIQSESAKLQAAIAAGMAPAEALKTVDQTYLSPEALAFAANTDQRKATLAGTNASTALANANTGLVGANTQEQLIANAAAPALNEQKLTSMKIGNEAGALGLKEQQLQLADRDEIRKITSDIQQRFSGSEAQALERVQQLAGEGKSPTIIQGVLSNLKNAGQLYAKGDANSLPDIPESRAGAQIGTVAGSIPDRQAVIDAYMPRMYGGEGGSRNGGMVPNSAGASSAFGPAQFTEGTWLDTVKQYDPATVLRLGSNAKILALRNDPTYHKDMARKFTEGNADLIPKGVPINDASLYTMHFFGRGAGPKVLTADGSLPLSEVVPSSTISANPQLKGMNVAQARSWAANYINKQKGVGPTIENAQAIGASSTRTPIEATAFTPVPQGASPQALFDISKSMAKVIDSDMNRINTDEILDRDANLVKSISEAKDKNNSQAEVLDSLKKKIGDLEGINWLSNDAPSDIPINKALTYVKNKYGLNDNMAGAIVENSIGFTNNFMGLGKSIKEIDYAKLDENVNRIIDTSGGKSEIRTEYLKKAEDATRISQEKAALNEQLKNIKSEQEAARLNLSMVLANKGNRPDVVVDKERERLEKKIIESQKRLERLRESPAYQAYTKAITRQ